MVLSCELEEMDCSAFRSYNSCKCDRGVFNVKKGDSRNGVHVIRLLFMGTNSR